MANKIMINSYLKKPDFIEAGLLNYLSYCLPGSGFA